MCSVGEVVDHMRGAKHLQVDVVNVKISIRKEMSRWLRSSAGQVLLHRQGVALVLDATPSRRLSVVGCE